MGASMGVGAPRWWRALMELACGNIFGAGDDSHIRFWHDNWCRDQSLKEAFHELFQIASNKEAWVRDHMQLSNGVIQWNDPFL